MENIFGSLKLVVYLNRGGFVLGDRFRVVVVFSNRGFEND